MRFTDVAPRAGLEPATLRLTVAARRCKLSSYRDAFINRFKDLSAIRPQRGFVPNDFRFHRGWVQFWVHLTLTDCRLSLVPRSMMVRRWCLPSCPPVRPRAQTAWLRLGVDPTPLAKLSAYLSVDERRCVCDILASALQPGLCVISRGLQLRDVRHGVGVSEFAPTLFRPVARQSCPDHSIDRSLFT